MKIAKFCFAVAFVLQSFFAEAVPPGTFTQIPGSPFAAGSAPAWSTYSPIIGGNLFAAVPNYNDQTVSVYVVDQTTGGFTQVPGSPFSTGVNPAWLAYSPITTPGNLFSGIVNANDNTVSVYQVDATTGAFTEIPGSPFATGAEPYSISFSPIVDGNLFAAVANSVGNTVSVYSVDQTAGTFTEVPGSPYPSGSGPYTVVFSPVVLGHLFASVTNFNDNTITVYEVNETTGAFTTISGSPFPSGSGPYGIAYAPVVGGKLLRSGC